MPVLGKLYNMEKNTEDTNKWNHIPYPGIGKINIIKKSITQSNI